eukprot:CAMPEP_0116856676 /NCGR_PEP_ID=MMETSP0418-20121206/20070_1 /TAXON_ID=1158023 /ORGANISM="Astrosyne radiata, Strain 13vi08-1A" /LENGTH=361 /DNA_ID=CAMNT_0004490155 /DNA_START=123 /DNA_END=1208 /DNA_ORIENTATION=+
MGTLHWNYQRFFPYHHGPCWSIEIKPKAGYRATSPLVSPRRRAKYRFPRFQILQQLAWEGHIRKGWMSSSQRRIPPSLYSPLDLFSMDITRIHRALQDLLKTPQNNLKIWRDETQILGVGCETKDIHHNMQGILSIVQEILWTEDLLPRIKQLQTLDILDADGAVLVYEHLVRLCNGSNNLAESLLDDIPQDLCLPHWHHQKQHLEASPFHLPPNGCHSLDRLLELYHRFQEPLSVWLSDLPGNSSEKKMDSIQKACVECVLSLSEDACLYLLRNWLLSLVMCDVSVFVTICPQTETLGVVPHERTWKVVQRQQEAAPGIITSGEVSWRYTIKVVDCERKPSRKLQGRGKAEEAIELFVPP